MSADVEVPLTQRESEVLRHLASGATNKEIATALSISYETVKEHVQHILRKIGVNDRTQAAVWAVRKNLVYDIILHPFTFPPRRVLMPKPTDIRLRSVETKTERLSYRSPIKFGGR